MKMRQFTKAILIALLSVVAVTVTTTANATLICNAWNSGGSTSQSIYNCSFSGGSPGGSYVTSYNCHDYSFQNYCTISYTGGNNYQGNCCIVFTCYNGKSYYCDLNNWNGKDSIQCDDIPYDCKDIYVCQIPPGDTRSSVPEPSTVLAGALLLIPLGISTLRILRKHKATGGI